MDLVHMLTSCCHPIHVMIQYVTELAKPSIRAMYLSFYVRVSHLGDEACISGTSMKLTN